MRRAMIVLLSLAAASGCVESDVVQCADGRICSAGAACDEVHHTCVLPGQLSACDGKVEGDDCDINGQDAGICHDDVCIPRICGDGFVRGTEQCDGDNLGDVVDCTQLGYHQEGELRCQPDCAFDTAACGSRCGDGTADLADGEDCDLADLGGNTCVDLGYDSGTLACLENCRFDRFLCTGQCGDGARNVDEACDGSDFGGEGCPDHGYYTGQLACNETCDVVDVSACSGACGDDERNGPELCDGDDVGDLTCAQFGYHGGTIACADTCDAPDLSGCQGYCGDGVANGDELCDGLDQRSLECDAFGATGGALGCNAYCQPTFEWCHWGLFRSVASPTTSAIAGVWAASRTDAWAAGDDGVLLHWDGVAWTAEENPPPVYGHVFDVFGFAADDVWTVGVHGQVGHYDGTSWSNSASTLGAYQALRGIHGSAPDDIWAVGALVIHWNGVAWTQVASGGTGMNAVWAASSTDAWAVGGSVIRHWDGTTWTAEASGTTANLTDVWGDGAGTVWAVGGSTILRRSAGIWTTISAGIAQPNFRTVWGSGPQDVWAAGDEIWRFDGTTWSAYDTSVSATVVGMFGTATEDLWAVGFYGAILHSDGPGWTKVAAGLTEQLWAIDARADANVWIGAFGGGISHYDGATWTTQSFGYGTTVDGVWASAADDVWAVADSAMRHSDGSGFTQVAFGQWNALWASAADDVWAVGRSRIDHYDGSTWSSVTSPSTGTWIDVWGSAADDIWAVGWDVGHYDGTSWQEITEIGDDSTDTFYSVHGAGGGVWMVGDPGVSWYGDDLGWIDVPGPTGQLDAVWSTRPGEAWVSHGDHGGLAHFDGLAWSEYATGSGSYLMDLSGSGDSIWACGGNGAITRLTHALPRIDAGACEDVRPIYCGTTAYGGVIESDSAGRTYRLDAPVSGDVALTLAAVADLGVEILTEDASGACDPTTAVAVADSATFSAARGTRYYLRVDGDPGTFRISLDCAAP